MDEIGILGQNASSAYQTNSSQTRVLRRTNTVKRSVKDCFGFKKDDILMNSLKKRCYLYRHPGLCSPTFYVVIDTATQ